jgi:uncharacterized DUF497 family protein
VAVQVRALVWDEQNEEHIAEHGVTPREVNQMVENPHIVVKNRRHRRGQHLMIGRTHGGRVLTVPLTKTSLRDTWRPTTAYPANDAQTRLLDQNSSGSPKERS